MNKAFIIGRVGRDPEARSLANGARVVNLSVATSERYKDKDGNRQERTQWHRVVCWNEHLGKVLEDYVRKGSRVMVSGQIETRKYKDRDNVERETTEIVLGRFSGEVELLGDGPNGERQGGGSSSGGGRAPGAGGTGAGRGGDLDDDIPFGPEWR